MLISTCIICLRFDHSFKYLIHSVRKRLFTSTVKMHGLFGIINYQNDLIQNNIVSNKLFFVNLSFKSVDYYDGFRFHDIVSRTSKSGEESINDAPKKNANLYNDY